MTSPPESSGRGAGHGLATLLLVVGLAVGAYSIYLATSAPRDSAHSQSTNSNATGSSADLANSGLASVDESYTGMHKYFNDWKPAAVISVIFIVIGLVASSRGRPGESGQNRSR